MPLLVRVRPNLTYLVFLALGVALILIGVSRGDVIGSMIIAGGVMLLVVFGYPVVVSTLLRVPVVAATAEGVRLPMMGLRLAWNEINEVRRDVQTAGSRSIPVLLIVPASAASVLLRMRPWLRGDARRALARYGTPIVIPGRSLDRSLDEIEAALTSGIG